MTERAQRIRSIRIIEEYHWMLLRQLDVAVRKRLGEPGMAALRAGLELYGRYRGESLRQHPLTCAEGRDALSLLRAWDVAELAVASPNATPEVTGNAARATVNLARVPGSEYFAKHEDRAILATYWRAMLAGLTAGYDEALSVTYPDIPADPAKPWSITFSYSGDVAHASAERPKDAFSDSAQAVRLSRRTMGVVADLPMYVARPLAERFDATAEEVMRKAIYNFGAERASGMREQVLAEGKPLNFQTWFDTIQKRDPNAASYVFRDERRISPGVFQLTCTYCPCAEVWAEEGPKGLAFGYLYDMELHRGLVEGFHPGGVVTWDKVKSRGDKVCDFRFFIPELVTADDPEWARKASR
jgi:hypothetical protein